VHHKLCVYSCTIKTETGDLWCVALNVLVIEKEITAFQIFEAGIPYQSIPASFHNWLEDTFT
jgi:hypothetical protein